MNSEFIGDSPRSATPYFFPAAPFWTEGKDTVLLVVSALIKPHQSCHVSLCQDKNMVHPIAQW